MRKLFVLMLAIGIHSLVNASYLISVDGIVNPPDSNMALFPSQTATLGVHGFNNGNTPQEFWLLCEGPGLISGGIATYPGNFNEIITFPIDEWRFQFEWERPDRFERAGYYGVTSAMYAQIGDFSLPLSLNGLLIDEISFYCEGPGDVTLTLINGVCTTVYDTQIIHQTIPEPATLALLCLGSLILRRKK